MNFLPNQRVKVSKQSPFHAGRIGYYQSTDEMESDLIGKMIILSIDPVHEGNAEAPTYFAVLAEFVELF